jgi:dienelactone hydrolase
MDKAPLGRIFRGVTILRSLVILAVLAGVVLWGDLWVEHRTMVTLPTPTGPFAVGRSIYDWTDENDRAGEQAKRELLVWIWYPADGQADAGLDDYVPAPVRLNSRDWLNSRDRLNSRDQQAARSAGFLDLASRDLSKVREHSLRDIAVSPREPSYPVVIMRGGASASVHGYSTLAEDLASHGYVVVGLDAAYRTGEVVFPDGRVIERGTENDLDLVDGAAATALANELVTAWSADMSFALDQLARLNASDSSGRFQGRLDLDHVGAFGHSLGGAEVLQFCHDDFRCKAGVNIDGAPWGSVIHDGVAQALPFQQPLLFLMSDHKLDTLVASAAELEEINANLRTLFARLSGDRTIKLMIPGSNHYMFSDDVVLRSHLVLWMLRRLHILGIDGTRQVAITEYCLHAFFDAYLKGPGRERPAILSPQYPELRIYWSP